MDVTIVFGLLEKCPTWTFSMWICPSRQRLEAHGPACFGGSLVFEEYPKDSICIAYLAMVAGTSETRTHDRSKVVNSDNEQAQLQP